MTTSHRLARFLCVAFLAATTVGCFDLETEIRLLSDGSGIVTSWVRIDKRDAAIATELAGSGLDEEIASALAQLRAASTGIDGLDPLDESVYEEAGRIVLRYRLVFDRLDALNKFWASEAVQALPYVVSSSTLAMKAPGGLCGEFFSEFVGAKRDTARVIRLDDPALAELGEAARNQLVERLLSGRFRLRLTVPGVTTTHNASLTDVDGFAVYDTTMLDFIRNGLTARVKSRVECGQSPESLEPRDVTVGPAPDPGEVAEVLRVLPSLAQLSVEFTQVSRSEANVRVRIESTLEAGEALQTYLPILLACFPNATAGMTMESTRTPDGRIRFEFATKEPVNFRKTPNSLVFMGRDGAIDVFRMNLPASVYAQRSAEGERSRRILTVKVTMPSKIEKTNATEQAEQTAVWVITDKMLNNPVTLEAVSYSGLLKP